MPTDPPTPGRVVLYRTDGRNGLVYDLPALVTVTAASHPGDYPDGSANPLPVPGAAAPDPTYVHLTILSPGGYGTRLDREDVETFPNDADYIGAPDLIPGSGSYVEHSVPHAGPEHDGVPADVAHPDHPTVPARSWRWPVRPQETPNE